MAKEKYTEIISFKGTAEMKKDVLDRAEKVYPNIRGNVSIYLRSLVFPKTKKQTLK